ERSKSQIEQLEQEQQELESLKSEFSLNSNELVDENKVEREQVGFILETNTPDSLVDNTNSRKENSDTITPTLVTSSSNNSKESRKAWIIGGTVGFFIFLGLMINGNRANQTITNIEQQTSDRISSETIKQDNILKTEDIIEPSPEVSTQLQEQNFDYYDFPLDSCGDKDPGGANIWYRVYIDDTPENLNTIHSNYCRDAIRKYRQQEQMYSIQVASFINKLEAEQFANLMQEKIGSGEVGEPTIYNLDKNVNSYLSQDSLINSKSNYSGFNESYEGVNESESIALIVRLYDLLSQKSFAETESLYSSQLTNQFNSNFFSQFQRVTVENLRIISKNQNLINFIGQNTYIWLDGSTQTESRSYTVENLGGELKITDSQFIKVIKFK
ncbi:MAG: hypothetical protein RLZZ04_3648, partial [Cyanobacteriota bacterium]